MTDTLDDLLTLIRDRSTEDCRLNREELHGLLDGFGDVADREAALAALAAMARKGTIRQARVTAEALAYLGKRASVAPLLTLAEDTSIEVQRRAAAASALLTVGSVADDLVTAEERFICTGLYVLDLLSEAEDRGAALDVVVQCYLELPEQGRLGFIDAVAGLAAGNNIRIALVLMHLVGLETDSRRRHKLLDRAAAERTQEAANLLAAFAQKTKSKDDAKAARKHLHLLKTRGIEGRVAPEFGSARAFVSGCDGDACFTMTLVVPRPPVFDLAHVVVHLSSGVRDGFVEKGVPDLGVQNLTERIRKEIEAPWTEMPLAELARILKDVPRRGAKEDEESRAVWTLMEPVLASVATIPPEASNPGELSAEDTRAMLNAPAFRYWFFEADEDLLRPSVDGMFGTVEDASGELTSDAITARLQVEVSAARERAIKAGEPERLHKMLRHQARVLERMGEAERARAANCRAASQDVLTPTSVFLSVMIERSIAMAIERHLDPDGDPDMQRWEEAREHLRGRLGEPARAPRKHDMAVLDVSAAAHAALNRINRRAPSIERAPLNVIEKAALDIGRQATARVMKEPDVDLELDSEAVEKILERHALFAPADRQENAEVVCDEVEDFIGELCFADCAQACFDDPDGDARVAYFAEEPPWDVEVGQVRRGW